MSHSVVVGTVLYQRRIAVLSQQTVTVAEVRIAAALLVSRPVDIITSHRNVKPYVSINEVASYRPREVTDGVRRPPF